MSLPYGNEDYVVCARRIRHGRFEAEPGKTRFLKVPREKEAPEPSHAIPAARWFDEVRDRADGMADNKIDPAGDVLVFVHGYCNDQKIVLKRLRRLQADLFEVGFRGLVVSFDWPSANATLNYLEDRWDAAQTAIQLVTGAVVRFAEGRRRGCQTNVHLLGHSTGAYVIREAFHTAMKRRDLYQSNWQVSQIAFIGGDISSASLGVDHEESRFMFERCLRLTNYSNRYDKVLKVSNAKRLGTRPRVGRVGLPENAHPKCVNIDCSDYFRTLKPGEGDQPVAYGTFCHSWHIGNKVFARDLAWTLHGGMDREVIPTRKKSLDGALVLQPAAPLPNEKFWLDFFDGDRPAGS